MKGLMGGSEPPSDPPARVDTARPRYSTGAIGAVSRSIESLKRRSVVEVDARMIDGAGLRDRLDAADPELDLLKESIRVYGQQVPVLLRPNPNDPERYQVVYGRRRVAALKALGQPIKALVRLLDDKALVLAQGQENTARKDLTFIEKANFARQMREAGYDRKTMCDALAIDKTVISRMLSIADRVPLPLIEAIGSAPGVGRERWLTLADAIGDRDLTGEAKGKTSDARFDAVMSALRTPRPKPAKPDTVKAADGKPLAQAARRGGKLILTLNENDSAGFDQWLVNHLPEIHRDWKKKKRGE